MQENNDITSDIVIECVCGRSLKINFASAYLSISMNSPAIYRCECGKVWDFTLNKYLR